MTCTRLRHPQRVRKMELTKRLIRGAIKTVTVIAATVLFLGRMTGHAELLVSVGPVVVLVVCLALWKFIEDDDVNTGYWPPKPEKSVKIASALNATMPSVLDMDAQHTDILLNPQLSSDTPCFCGLRCSSLR
jgi:hypothetical protein